MPRRPKGATLFSFFFGKVMTSFDRKEEKRTEFILIGIKQLLNEQKEQEEERLGQEKYKYLIL